MKLWICSKESYLHISEVSLCHCSFSVYFSHPLRLQHFCDQLCFASLQFPWLFLAHMLSSFRCLLCMRQIDLKADVSTTVVTELNPKTDYSLILYAIYPSRIGDSATITVQTSGCHTSMHELYMYTNTCVHLLYIAQYLTSLSNDVLSFSPFGSGVKLPCYWGGSVLSAPGLDASSGEDQRVQDLHPKMYANITSSSYYY